MKRIGLIYWPKGGNVESVAQRLYDQFDKSYTDLFDILSINTTDLVNYNCLIIGGSTVGSETWQEATSSNHWNTFFANLDKINLKNKSIALFGLGDQVLYPDHFVDGMAFLKQEFEKRGAVIVGRWPDEGYTYTDSEAVEDGKFYGLALDEDQQPELTDERIKNWIELLKKELCDL